MMAPADRVDLALACLAVDYRLGGVLLVGLPPVLLPFLGRRLGAMLADEPNAAEVVSLGASQGDDDLWWVPEPVGADGKFQFVMVPGPLVDVPGGPPRTVIIPDLARASLAIVRAAVTIIGADTAVADRYGRHISWRPRTRWLAACASSDLSRLSPHLLDRFCVRVDASGLSHSGPGHAAMLAAVYGNDSAASWDDAVLLDFRPPPVTDRWRETPKLPHMPREAIEAVMAVIDATAGIAEADVRRDLALARVARALALLGSYDTVRDEHVLSAAAVMGLAQVNPRDTAGALRQGRSPSSDGNDPGSSPDGGADIRGLATAAEAASCAADGTTDEAAMAGNEPTAPVLLDPVVPSDLLQPGAHPEDAPGALAEYASLRETWQLERAPRAMRGQVGGIEPTQSPSDIAVVPTAFEAAKFQALRRKRSLRMRPGLIVFGSDLRRYRYLPRPDTAVVLVLDHTCRHEWDFALALAPYLRWAYVRHALLSVVEFGHQGAPNELRASTYRASSVLDRRVTMSLDRLPGRATPLAHGLDTAVQEMRRHLRQAEVIPEKSWLIVVSDGRGNVPLEASQRGHVSGLVGREGVTDALSAARAVRGLQGVHKVVLAPPTLTYYARLPFDLADAMGAIVADDTP
jgi:magnesium chelatase subunit D